MYNSIKYFEEECINRFEKLEDNFMKKPAEAGGVCPWTHRGTA